MSLRRSSSCPPAAKRNSTSVRAISLARPSRMQTLSITSIARGTTPILETARNSSPLRKMKTSIQTTATTTATWSIDGEGKLDASGQMSVEFDVPESNKDDLWDFQYRLEAQVTDSSRRSINAAAQSDRDARKRDRHRHTLSSTSITKARPRRSQSPQPTTRAGLFQQNSL